MQTKIYQFKAVDRFFYCRAASMGKAMRLVVQAYGENVDGIHGGVEYSPGQAIPLIIIDSGETIRIDEIIQEDEVICTWDVEHPHEVC